MAYSVETNRRCHGRRSFAAFTLVELLVVIAIICMLVALLLPAVQAARESSRRSQCASQERQLGIAASNFFAAKGHFPPGVEQRYFNSAVSHRGVPLFVRLFPFMEHGVMLFDWDYDDPINNVNQGDDSKAAIVLPILVCASDDLPENPISVSQNWQYALTSYGGNGGTRGYFPQLSTADGVFFTTGEASEPKNWQRPVEPRDITDGLSNTVAFGERSHLDPNYETFNAAGMGEPLKKWGWWAASASRKMVGHVTMSAFAPINYQLPFSYDARSGQSPPADSFAQFNANYVDLRIAAFGSNHPGGANFCFTDGSLRFLTTETDQSVLTAAYTRAADD